MTFAAMAMPSFTQFDVDGNGVVNSTDVALVRNSQGRRLSGTLHLDA